MAFPDEPLGLRVEMQADGVWTDITDDVYTRDPITHTRGIPNNSRTADPASVPLTINNRAGKYSPRNPESPYYGLGRNTPVRLSLPGAPVHLALDGTRSGVASTPDAAALDITGDLDLRIEAEVDDWYAAGARTLIGKWDRTIDRSYLLRLEDGLLRLHLCGDGNSTFYFVFCALPADLPHRAALRVTYQPSISGVRRTICSWAPTMAGPWIEFGRVETPGAAFPIHAGTAPLTVAPTDVDAAAGLDRRPVVGSVYRAEVRAGVNGTLVAAPDFTAQTPGTSSFTDSAGRTWTVGGTAQITDRWPRFVGEISSWPQKWAPGGHDVWVPVEAAGILRRYGQGAKPLDSAFRRRIMSGAPVAYWPMEDGPESQQAYSPVPGVQAMTVGGFEFGQDDSLVSSLALPSTSSGGTFGAYVPAAPTSGSWLASHVYLMSGPPPAEITLLDVETTGAARHVRVSVDASGIRFRGYASSGAQLWATYVLPLAFYGQWTRLAVTADQSGSTTTYTLRWRNVEASGFDTRGVVTGSAGHVVAVSGSVSFGESSSVSLSVGHVAVFPTSTNILDGADNAYRGERARARMVRVTQEEGIPLDVVRGRLSTPRMGPQTADTLLSVLGQAAEVDGGMLHEASTHLALAYRERSSLYTQEPALVLDYQAPGLAPPLEPVDDDSETRNDITVQRAGGSSARAVLESGPLSVQPPPGGIGEYAEATTLNLFDDVQPTYWAAWRLHLATYDGARYPSVRVLLHRAPELIPAVRSLREGDLIRLVNLPPWVSREPVDLLVQGWSETFLPRRWEIVFNCSPGGPWNTAVADHPVYSKAGTDGSEVAADATTTATALPVRVTAGPSWTTDPAEMPIDITVGGEVMRATSITAAASDSFARTVAGDWGTADSGQAWTTAGGTSSSFSVTGGTATMAMSTNATHRTQLAIPPLADVDLAVTLVPSVLAAGAAYTAGLVLRQLSASDYYHVRAIAFGSPYQMGLWLTRVTAAGQTDVASVYVGTYSAGQPWRLRGRITGSRLQAKLWPAGAEEPVAWQVEGTDTALSGPGLVGLRAYPSAANTNTKPLAIGYRDLTSGEQLFTVQRSVNGVVKAHPAGAPLGLAHPAITSL